VAAASRSRSRRATLGKGGPNMSDMTQGTRTGPRDLVILAIVLIVVGIGGLALQRVDTGPGIGGLIVLTIGLAFLGAFIYTRQYGYLIPGGIMTGLGGGILASASLTLTDEETGGVVVLGLGLGFLSIWVIGAIMRVAEGHWWPVIPGGILAIVGGALLIGGQAVDLLDYWGVAVIAAGLLVLVRALMQGRASEPQ
ncbi:MAG: hypothetical protein OEV61_09735, partial [Chloroflexota bacterium]|nr:hypothetical protein [Chloroflexota bacterium]